MTATKTWQEWSCTVRLVVDEPAALDAAATQLAGLMSSVDEVANRFRADSVISRANARAGWPIPVPPLLGDLLVGAFEAAAWTDGLVDPMVGMRLIELGYDRDLARIADRDRTGAVPPGDAADAADAGARATKTALSWRQVRFNAETLILTVPEGGALDLGSTAKAQTADIAAKRIRQRLGVNALVEIGGDIAVDGGCTDGWRIQVAESEGGDGQLVALHSGGLATSTTTLRRWRHDGKWVHHILDPRTGQPADGPWRTVSVAAESAARANAASLAALVLGHGAAGWLARRTLAARLVAADGSIVTTEGWPAAGRVGEQP